MDTQKAAGNVREVVGKVQEAAGDFLGSTSNQAAGKAKELGGKAQQLYADTTELVRDKAIASPLSALAVAAGLGFLLGAIWSSASDSPRQSYPSRYRGRNDY